MSDAGPPLGANCAPFGGSEAAAAASVGVRMSDAGPSQAAGARP
jgi:hypothetical protein